MKRSELSVIKAVARGIEYLSGCQNPNGSFTSLSSKDPLNFKKALNFSSVFSSILILQALTELSSPEAAQIAQKLAGFLLSQKSKHHSFNYWDRSSEEYKHYPYPDDLDDTFCALSALYLYNPGLIDGPVLAKAVNLLTISEISEGGPYKTWLADDLSDQVWKDVDIAVNSNIAYFLSLIDISLPRLSRFLEKNIANQTLESPYYPSIYPVVYFMSRFYKGRYKKQLAGFISGKGKKGVFKNPLETALALLAFDNLKHRYPYSDAGILDILKSQNRDGSWNTFPFYTGVNPAKNGRFYAGSKALTTAFCLQLLSRHLKKETRAREGNDHKSPKKISSDVYKVVKSRFEKSGPEISSISVSMISQIKKIDRKTGISQLPFIFAAALNPHNRTVPVPFLVNCGVANVFGWMAYTIYDDFWDENPRPDLLSLANISLRELSNIYSQLLEKETGFPELFNRIIDKIEEANTFEQIHWRVNIVSNCLVFSSEMKIMEQDYRIYADRSIGHALAPLAVLFYLGYKEDSPEVQNLLNFFQCYLIARQLNDDAHDFESDLKNGHLNPVIGNVLKKYFIESRSTNINLETDLAKLQTIFWHQTITEICRDIKKYINLAKKNLTKIKSISDYNLIYNLLDPVSSGADEALRERKKAIEFLDSYTVH